MSTVWADIRSKCKPLGLSEPFKDVFVTNDRGKWHWVIGRHPDLSKLATLLRTNEELCDELWDSKVRFGFRTSGKNPSDVPPLGKKRQERYGKMKKQTVTDHLKDRKKSLYAPVSDEPVPRWRISDEFKNVATYWPTQTPQAHHIVEYNNLKRLGLSSKEGKSDLDYDELPCVLLMAEFHQRYISSVLKQTHGIEGSKSALLEKFHGIYEGLYRDSNHGKGESSPFRSLWEISEVVFKAAKKKLPG